MAGKLFFPRDYYRRRRYGRNIYINYISNILYNDFSLPEKFYYIKRNQGKKHSISPTNTRCVFSGRARAVMNLTNMSRMIFKKYAEKAMINGIRKASW